MTCPHCATELDDTARFCGACGARLATGGPPPPQKKYGLESQMKTIIDPALSPARSQASPGPIPGTAGTPFASNPRPLGAAIPQGTPAETPRGAASSPGGGRASPASAIPIRPLTPASGAAPPAAAPPGAGATSPVPADPFIGRMLNNRYLVEAKLGEGGFGAVYRGRQVQIGREVALKVLHPEMARDPSVVARFRREGVVACNLRDAHTITTYDFDQTADGVLYIAMELLKGRSLHDVFQQQAPLPWTRVFRILEQICSSLAEAHAQGIVHRDLKPENIYLEQRGTQADYVKVLDFGIAKIVGGEIGQQSPQLTATGQTLGTLEYMSPEQLMGKQLDGRSDIYALGVVSYELLTGRLPFPDAHGPTQLIAAQLRRVPDLPSAARPDAGIPPAVDRIILRMLEKDRAKRYADVNELRAAIQEALVTGGRDAAGQVVSFAGTAGSPSCSAGPGGKVGGVAAVGGDSAPMAVAGARPPAGAAPALVVSDARAASDPGAGRRAGGPSFDLAMHAPASREASPALWWFFAVLILVGGALGIYFGILAK